MRRVTNGQGGGADTCSHPDCDLFYSSPNTLRCSGFCNAEACLDDLALGISQDSVGLALMATGDNYEEERCMFAETMAVLTKHRHLASDRFVKAANGSTEAKDAWNEMEIIDKTAAQLEALERRIEARGWGVDPDDEKKLYDTLDEALTHLEEGDKAVSHLEGWEVVKKSEILPAVVETALEKVS